MSTFDDYLTHDDKPYAENINDALLLSNVFDLTVPIELPTMYRTGVFSTSTSPRKAGVSIVTMVNADDTDFTITGSSITNDTADVKGLIFKYYPNFNSYGTISSLSWTASGTGVIADIEGADGEDILTGHTGGTISGATTGLTELQEFTITLSIPAGVTITKINFIMANKEETRYGAECGITDVTGLQSALDAKVSLSALTDLIYPVGSIYMSVDSTSPATRFGGTWTQLKDRFLLSAGDTYNAGATGGETNHTLTTNEMPSHNHDTIIHNHQVDGGKYNVSRVQWESGNDATFSTISTERTGGGQSHNNMPPYLVVYMWKRTG